jgi:hypothetical protein
MKPFITTLYLCILGAVSSCSFPLKNADLLVGDPKFLYMDSDLISGSNLDAPDLLNTNLKFYRERQEVESLGFSDKNNYYVLEAKNGNLDFAERGFRDLLNERSSEMAPFLNLVRMYYIIQEFEVAKKFIRQHVERNRIPFPRMKPILDKLESSYRLDERGMVLEAVQNIPEFQYYSWKELGKYFIFKRDLSSAEYYLQKILTGNPFDEESLLLMAEICLDEGRWSELVDYGKALHLTNNGKKYSYYFIGRGYFERLMYKEGLEWLEKAPDSEKQKPEFLILWKDLTLSVHPYKSLESIRRYFRMAREKGFPYSEEEFLPTIHPKGREIMEGFVR